MVECDEKIARARLIVRHVATGVGKDEGEAAWRGEWEGKGQYCWESTVTETNRHLEQRTTMTYQTEDTFYNMSSSQLPDYKA